MASKIYVSGFPPSYTQKQLRQIFVPFGNVKSVQVQRDKHGYFIGVVQTQGLEAFMSREGDGSMGLLSAIDLVMAMPVSWLTTNLEMIEVCVAPVVV